MSARADAPGAQAQRVRAALGRSQTAEDVAATVAHLAGDGGRAITGTALLVDAGRTRDRDPAHAHDRDGVRRGVGRPSWRA
ncbi:SDR family oxidoreductase [Pseudonocardia asaccharolytica]|uniref:Uncharacterized protein n=1 Tax=Pseudonocardia asaccharolytica DSM 44247 = NBRC 16224 TaxID=1123024 RepID=A0A511D2E2_9PSEU|nr:SDR family oxidoreductase [Pseudonocardia asaccharolytica]GEL18951.1 hypothetical protein PA7_27880 [Pseudonocardia asaccharolytica DSM 44247 = NBRC 16224]